MVKLKGKLIAVVEQSSIFRLSERCLFIEVRGKPSDLFCCCGTFRRLQSE